MSEQISSGGRWILVIIDLSSRSKGQRTAARKLRHWLIDHGYQTDGSVSFYRYIATRSAIAAEVDKIRSMVPEKGIVQILQLTNGAHGRLQHFVDGQHCTVEGYAELLTVY